MHATGLQHARRAVERADARLKDEFGGRHLRVLGYAMASPHPVMGVVALTVDQLRAAWHAAIPGRTDHHIPERLGAGPFA